MELDYLVQNLVKQQKLPAFTLRAHLVSVCTQPIEFYRLLLDGIKTARSRVCLSSLYLGSGNFQTLLLETVKSRLLAQPLLQFSALFDYNRSQRVQRGESGVDRLRRLKESQFGDRVKAGFRRRASRQILGVHHQKIYILDDRVVISGANLSGNYFTNRQDRYMEIESSELADYLADWISLNISSSHQIHYTGELRKGFDKKAKAPLLWQFMHRPDQQQLALLDRTVLAIAASRPQSTTLPMEVAHQPEVEQATDLMRKATGFGQLQNLIIQAERQGLIGQPRQRPTSQNEVVIIPQVIDL